MQVFSQHTSTSTEVRSTISALVVTLRTLHGVMDNASGSSLDADLFNSMSQSLVITSSAIANSQLILHSVMALINI
jgi:hypothetical protein